MPFIPLLQMEAQVRGCNKYSPKEIKVLIRTHPNDFSSEIETIFFDLKDSGRTFRLVILEEVDEATCEKDMLDEPLAEAVEEVGFPDAPKERDPMAVKRQSLALNIKSYAEQHKKTEAEVVKDLYDTYSVTSRSQLTEKQLDLALAKYKPLHPSEVEYYRDNGLLA